MKHLLAATMLAIFVAITMTGCIPLLVGGVIGYEISKQHDEDHHR
jgi:hypothetical protein